MAVLAVTSAVTAHAAGTPDEAWPDKVVTIEELRPLAPMRIRIAHLVVRGAVRGPATLRVHVDAGGDVVRSALLESCGNADADEAAIQAVRGMKFEPYRDAGVPTEVTLVLPLHIPKNVGRAR